MSCCGKKRKELLQHMQHTGNQPLLDELPPARVPDVPSTFEYTGLDLLILKGAVTGKNYYFKYPGARVDVAPADAYAMLAEPQLEPVRFVKS
ncbi:hypothetical protein ACTHGU_12020 [Chitinophagaceae bacterium MMS25-I14]